VFGLHVLEKRGQLALLHTVRLDAQVVPQRVEHAVTQRLASARC
jgi:hypothetical protein